MKGMTLMTLAGLLAASLWPAAAPAAEDGEREILYWVAPMDPNYRRDKPGKSPMGMDLIPVYADEQDSGGGIAIKPEIVQSLGVRTAKAQRTRLWRLIDTVGYVDFDESKLNHIHLRATGWIEKLYFKSEGERVKKGDRLLDLYSPELVNAQEEYVQALRVGSKPLIRASRERLQAYGIPNDQIRELARTYRVRQTVTIYAPQDGMVATLPVREGMYVTPANRIMSLADLSSIWVLAEIFERQVDWVSLENPAEITLSYLPGRTWEGKVRYIYPNLDPKTRTLKVRLRFDNPGEQLKPNMYANVRIFGGPKDDVIAIPLEALIRTGREERVILALGDGRFEARKVRSGMESGDMVEILEGIEPGDTVVTSGQFLIDSEASLKATLERMTPVDTGPIETRGRIISLMPEHHMVKLEHEAIPELGWEAMSHDLIAAEGVDLSAVKPGDAVSVTLEKQGEGYVITALSPAAPITGRGTVQAVMADHGMLTLEHEPIEALGWPAMTMDFTTLEGVDLSGLKPGDVVTFTLKPEGERWLIASVEKTAPVEGRGEVKAVMADHGMLTLEHEPIEALGWPAMTMDFVTAKGVDLSGLEPGDRVAFTLKKDGDRFVITAIRKLP